MSHTTIFADASYSSTHHTAGWGAWIWSAGSPALIIGGEIAELLYSSVEAETRALANALAAARSRALVSRGDTVHFRSDCTSALRHILTVCPTASAYDNKTPIRKARSPRLASASHGARAVADIAAAMHLTVLVSHVRGHDTTASAAQAINATCDTLAFRYHGQRMAKHKAASKEPDNDPSLS